MTTKTETFVKPFLRENLPEGYAVKSTGKDLFVYRRSRILNGDYIGAVRVTEDGLHVYMQFNEFYDANRTDFKSGFSDFLAAYQKQNKGKKVLWTSVFDSQVSKYPIN